MRDRVHGGDLQAEAHGRVGGRSPSLAEDLLALAELDDLPHGQEVARVVEIVDEVQLAGDLRYDGFRDVVSVTPARAFERAPVEQLRCRHALGQHAGGVPVAQFIHGEGAAFGYLVGAGDCFGVVGVEVAEGLRVLQGVLGVGFEESSGRGEGLPVAYAREHVLQFATLRLVVEHLRPGDEGGCRTCSRAAGCAPQ